MPLTMTPNHRRQRGRNASKASPSVGPNAGEFESSFDDYAGSRKSSPRMSQMADAFPVLTGGTPPSKKKEALIQPRTVTPLSNFRSGGGGAAAAAATPSWEDYGEGVFGAAHRAQRTNKGVSAYSSKPANYPVETSFEEEEMPMDELMATSKEQAQTPTRSVDPSETSKDCNNLGKIIAALESNSLTRPDDLTLEERMLWDVIQSTVLNASKRAKSDASAATSSRETELERKLKESEGRIEQLNQKLRLASLENKSVGLSEGSVKRINQLEEQLREKETELKTKELEHDVEVRAIQRVLAEMSAEREEETQVLNDTVAALSEKVNKLEKENQELQKNSSSSPPLLPPKSLAASAEQASSNKKHGEEIAGLKETIKDLEADLQTTRKDVDRKARRVLVLERDYKVLNVQLKKVEDEKRELGNSNASDSEKVEALKGEVEKLKDRNQKLKFELDFANKERRARRKTLGSMTPPRPDITSHTDVESVSSSMSAEDVESLQKNLSETSSSLENAKKIIASLENANGSMAVDLRAKLKAKEDELTAVQKESAERKRRLDSLATELRDLQKKHDDIERLESQSRSQIIRHKALMGLLEKSVSGLQAASAVHEVSTATGAPDQSNVDQITEILNDAMVGIRSSLELSENYMDEFDDASTVAYTDIDVSSEVGRQIDTIIKNDREAHATNLRDELEQKKIAVRRLEEALKKQTEELRRLRFEQKSSEDNQQLLAEIQSLREQCSTNMEVLAKKERELAVLRSSLKVDENDAGYISDDASEGDEDTDNSISTARLNVYGPEQTEALATLLAAGGSMPGQDSDLREEVVKAIREKEKAAKERDAERESLANAKLIISSLEKANKSMMEDLRSRLQDSNSAIASLLDKSMEHEKNSNTLREELEKLKKEKERLVAQLHENPTLKEALEQASDASSEEKKEEVGDEDQTATS